MTSNEIRAIGKGAPTCANDRPFSDEQAALTLRQLEQVAQDAHADVRGYILGIRSEAAGPALGFVTALHQYLDAFDTAFRWSSTCRRPGRPSLRPVC